MTIASRPSVVRDGNGYRSDLGKARSAIFLPAGLDRRNSASELICPSGNGVERPTPAHVPRMVVRGQARGRLPLVITGLDPVIHLLRKSLREE